jgi:hypothetical protein
MPLFEPLREGVLRLILEGQFVLLTPQKMKIVLIKRRHHLIMIYIQLPASINNI